jgi:hypothetical protein
MGFKKHRYNVDLTYHYLSLIIRILITLCLVPAILIFTANLKQDTIEFHSHILTTKTPHLILFGLLLMMLLNTASMKYLFVFVLGICGWVMISLVKLCWSYRSTLRQLMAKYWFSTMLSVCTLVSSGSTLSSMATTTNPYSVLLSIPWSLLIFSYTSVVRRGM